MLSKSKEPPKANQCPWCHETPFRRTVHLLDMTEHGTGLDSIRSHLLAEFPHQQEASGFFDSEIRSVEFVRANYKNWREWQKNKMSSLKIARLGEWLTPVLIACSYAGYR